LQALADHGNYMGMNAIWLVSVRKWQCCWARLLACVPACPFAFFALSCGIRAAGSSSSLRHCVTTLTNNLPPHQLPAITGLTGGGERGKVDGQACPRRLRSRTAPPAASGSMSPPPLAAGSNTDRVDSKGNKGNGRGAMWPRRRGGGQRWESLPVLTNTQTSACESEWRRGAGDLAADKVGEKEPCPISSSAAAI